MGVLKVEGSSEGAASGIVEYPRKEERLGKVLSLSSWPRDGPVATLSMLLVRDAPDEVEHVS